MENQLLYKSNQMRKLMREARLLYERSEPVLITGERGTGKGLLARTFYLPGQGNLEEVMCPAITETLAESELFGHERGSFTGAVNGKSGRFELARNGVVFLDEIGELPKAIQAKLLGVTQTGVYYRVGGQKPLRSKARLVCATNRDLAAMVQSGTFLPDLLDRLRWFVLHVPSLRDRMEDVPVLGAAFAKRENVRLLPAAEKVLMQYVWPGNVRELEMTVTCAAVRCKDQGRREIVAADIKIRPERVLVQSNLPTLNIDALRRMAILAALEMHNDVQRAAATELGLSARALNHWVQKYRLTAPHWYVNRKAINGAGKK